VVPESALTTAQVPSFITVTTATDQLKILPQDIRAFPKVFPRHKSLTAKNAREEANFHFNTRKKWHHYLKMPKRKLEMYKKANQ
jgi:hypothetical protein